MRASAFLATATLVLASLATAGTVGGSHPQTAGSRTTSFDHKTGNEWWVEVIVTGSPSRVEARDEGGAWVALSLKSWGAWAASLHIEPGHRVQFRASWTNGDAATSCWFTHPAGDEQCDGGTGGGNATSPYRFTHAGGNEWWIEAKVEPKPSAVQAMDTGGAWTPLAFKSWGEWAASFRIEPGNDVRFRAQGVDGVWHESCWFTHPAGTMIPCGGTTPPPAWPFEGSYVKYRAERSESYGGSYAEETVLNVTYTYSGGQWTRRCEGWHREWVDRETEYAQYNKTRIDETAQAPPPRYALPAKLGESAVVRGVGCIGGASGTAFGPVRIETVQNGTPVTVSAYYVEYHPIWPAYESGHWDAATGLTLRWGFGGSHSGGGGEIVDTDAPLAIQPPARTSWPFEGSYARYALNETGGRTSTMDYRYTNGGWTMTCTVRNADGTIHYANDASREAPIHGPLDNVGVGQSWELPIPDSWCHARWKDVIIERTQTITTTRNGAPYQARVWYADDFDDGYEDLDLWWDRSTGLLLEFDHNAIQGKLVDTDAPLARG